MPNLGKIVAAHNSKVKSTKINYKEPNCNCRGVNKICIMEGSRCQDSGVIYQAEVIAPNKENMKYVGVCAPKWKLGMQTTRQVLDTLKKGNRPSYLGIYGH